MKENFITYLSSFLFSKKIETRSSAVSGTVEVVYSGGRYVLDSVHVNYSFGGLHLVFQKAFSKFGIRDRTINKVLILGFGAGSTVSILQDEYKMKGMHIAGVEKDPEVIALAKKYFSVDTYKDLMLVCEDAYEFVGKSKEQFDLIVMDVFVDRDVPEKFMEEQFISSLSQRLSDKGILFYNLVVHNEKVRDKGAQLFKKMNEKIGKTEWVRIFEQRTENWVFVIDKTKKP